MQKIFSKITEQIQKNDSVIIISHKGMDLDAIGSSLCLYKIIESFSKKAFIYLDDIENNQTLKKSIELLKKNDIEISFITDYEMNKFSKENPLIIVVDTNKKGLLGYSKLTDQFQKLIVIDHHIKSDDTIPNTILTYIDNDKSSATEILYEYLDVLKMKIEPSIATIMLAGIEIDTNSFNIKTRANTFRTAASLLENGADNIEKQKLLKENKENYCKRQDFIKKSYMINENMALCMMDENIYERYQLALISEDLLQFDDVEASFTIGFVSKENIGISARSIGKIDVEKIMRMLGGGGHQTDAACLIESKNLEEVKKQLLQKLRVIK